MKTRHILSAVLILLLSACGGGSGGGGKSYQDIVDDGWGEFSSGDYEAAFDHFTEAIEKKPDEAAGYAGLGWALMLMDNLAQASGTFNTGSTKTNPTSDLYAGWAFALNAQKSYANSITRIDQALTMDASWNLFGGAALNLGVNDLRVLKAENQFMLGQFSASLATIKVVNPSFSLTAVTTDDDKAALALEIQRLKGLSKRAPLTKR